MKSFIMKSTFKPFLFVLALSFMFFSCSKEDDSSELLSKEYTPESIIGKTIQLNNGSKTTTISGFINVGTCSINNGLTFSVTPTYSYSKTDSKVAELVYTYKTSSSSAYAWIGMTYKREVALTFISSNGGNYTSFNTNTSSTIYSKTDFYSSESGKFTIN